MKCALIYDFDGTLAEGDCAQHGLMPALGIENIGDFWTLVKDRAKKDDGDEILSYLGLLAEKAHSLKSDELSYSNLVKHGQAIPLFPGVVDWFGRINEYARQYDMEIDHYIISSGLDAMIRGTEIGKRFRMIYACKYHYSEDGKTVLWPAQAINYTTKTQFLFRINKGIDNSWDNAAVNKFIEPESREVPFQKMIFFGDGDTDIPSMKMVRHQGGFSIAVFDQNKWSDSRTQSKVEKLIAEERANYVVPAVYEEGSQLDVTVKGLLQLFKRKGI
ncbi:haloacid dehalogenase-like hydrolase [Rahnella sp. H11b]|uniref:Haloacid dehalogenase-like hydrolase n=2 Tax=Rahnella bonaserana TaxID=2816248 RepID=A0ABS6LTY2_9GAMM|nr:haloacid dehalogenase-like hydrolase [Rahnella bonaserana]